jgi:hypothetical protein
MADPTQTCPRRMTDFGPWPRDPDLDTWTTGHGLIGQSEIGQSCSFCGSLHPDRFMELVREGWIVGPTDKPYKAYLERPFTAEEIASRKAAYMARFAGLSEQAVAELGEQYDREFTSVGSTVAKFYFQHLTVEQQDEFIALHNAHRIKFGPPGGFYVTPFFAQTRTPETGGE